MIFNWRDGFYRKYRLFTALHPVGALAVISA